MNILPLSAHRSTSVLGVLATAILLVGGGCKPPPPTGTSQATPPNAGSAPRQPTTADFKAFFAGMMPADVRVTEVKMDTPTRLPNTAPGTIVWLLSTKITLTPVEDLFALPSAQDTQPINDAVAELNRLVAWRNAYAASPYMKACGAFEVKVPAAPLPQLLVLTHAKDHPLPSIYAKVTAEWQVDHWMFDLEQGNAAPPDPGKLRSEFTGPTMVQGSPEAEKAIGGVRDAITQARKEIDAIRSRYTAQVVKGVQPGATYSGTVSYRADIAPCELRFLDLTPGGDAHFASFQVTLSGTNPPCWYTYKARVSTELPIPVPESTPLPINPYAVAGFNDGSNPPPPTHNVFQTFVRCSSNKVGRDTLANWLGSNDHGGQALLLLDGHIEGLINDFGNPGIRINVKQNP